MFYLCGQADKQTFRLTDRQTNRESENYRQTNTLELVSKTSRSFVGINLYEKMFPMRRLFKNSIKRNLGFNDPRIFGVSFSVVPPT